MTDRRWVTAFVAALGATAAIAVPLQRANRIMVRAAGRDIIALEHAGSARVADALLSDWGPAGTAAARRSLVWDFAFQPSYAATLALLVARTNQRYGVPTLPARAALGLPVGAALADAVEGVALLRLLDRGATDRRAQWARRAAWAKWAQLALTLGHLLGRPALHFALSSRRSRASLASTPPR